MKKYLMYLRKSRMDTDFDDHTVQETLNRHRKILNEFCQANKIEVDQVLEEVVSGESLAARPKMMELLELINTGSYSGVVCMDIDRLSRGSSLDSGYIMQILQVNGCKILTPTKTYDLDNESDEQFTDMKFMFSRYELKTITKRLVRGRNQSASEGKFLGSVPPFGYRVQKIQGSKGNTLIPIPEEAKVVQMIFEMYAAGTGYNTIAYNLNLMHLKTRQGSDWSQTSVVNILNNEVYIGKICWKREPQKKIIQDGKVVKRRCINPNYEIYEGMHEPIISDALWTRTKDIQHSRWNSSTPIDKTLQNPFSDLLVCANCGSRIRRNVPAKDRPKLKPWFRCSKKNKDCDCSKMDCDAVEDAIVDAMTEWLKNYQIQIKGTTPKQDNAEVALDMIRNQIQDLQDQQNKICDLLEKGVYTLDLFTRRNSGLEDQIQKLRSDERDLEDQVRILKKDPRKTVIPTTQKILDSYDKLNAKEKNLLWKQVLQKVELYCPKGGEMQIHIYPKI